MKIRTLTNTTLLLISSISVFGVSVSYAEDKTVTVPYSIKGLENDDIKGALTGELSFTEDQAFQEITITVNDEKVFQKSKNFTVELGQSPQGVRPGDKSTASGTIKYNTKPTENIDPKEYTITTQPTEQTVTEGSGQAFTLPVTISKPAPVGGLTLFYRLLGTGELSEGDIVGGFKGSFTIPAGKKSTVLEIQVYDDRYFDAGAPLSSSSEQEVINAVLIGFTEVTDTPSAGSVAPTEWTIIDNDSRADFSVSPESLTLKESGDNGTTDFEYTISFDNVAAFEGDNGQEIGFCYSVAIGIYNYKEAHPIDSVTFNGRKETLGGGGTQGIADFSEEKCFSPGQQKRSDKIIVSLKNDNVYTLDHTFDGKVAISYPFTDHFIQKEINIGGSFEEDETPQIFIGEPTVKSLKEGSGTEKSETEFFFPLLTNQFDPYFDDKFNLKYTLSGTGIDKDDFVDGKVSGSQLIDPEYISNDITYETENLIVKVKHDKEFEEDETFTITLLDEGLPKGLSLGEKKTATATIVNDDKKPIVATLSLNPSFSKELTEKNEEGNKISFMLTLSQPIDGDMSFNYKISGEDIDVSDITGVDTLEGQVKLSKQDFSDFDGVIEAREALIIWPKDDDVIENDETFTVELTAVSEGITLGDNIKASATILNDDNAEHCNRTIVAGNEFICTECIDGFTLANNVCEDENKDTDGDGLKDIEETKLGTDPNKADSDGDGLNDGDEVNTHKSNPNKTDSDDGGLADNLEIEQGKDPNDLSDDNPTASIEGKNGEEQRTTENSKTPLTFTVSLSHPAIKKWSIDYEISAIDTGFNKDDINEKLKGTVTFEKGEQFKDIILTVKDDNEVENNEEFSVGLGISKKETTPGKNNGIGGIIGNDDEHGVSINDSTNPSVKEGSDTTINFPVTLLNGTINKSFGIPYTISGKGITEDDFEGGLTGTVEMKAGQQSAILKLKAKSDKEVEDEEVFTVTIDEKVKSLATAENPDIDIRFIDNESATGSIINAEIVVDPVSVISLEKSTVENKEGAEGDTTNFDFTLKVEPPNDKAISTISMEYEITGNGIDEADFASATQGKIEIQGGEEKFTVEVKGDNEIEPHENFQIVFKNMQAILNTGYTGVGVGTSEVTGTGTILNDDVNYCADNPCQNGGECGNDDENKTFICTCTAEYKGKTCDELINNPPVVKKPIPNQEITAGSSDTPTFNLNDVFSDADDDVMTFSVEGFPIKETNENSGEYLPTGDIVGNPPKILIIKPYLMTDAADRTITVTAKDNKGGEVSTTFKLTVKANTTPTTGSSIIVTPSEVESGGKVKIDAKGYVSEKLKQLADDGVEYSFAIYPLCEINGELKRLDINISRGNLTTKNIKEGVFDGVETLIGEWTTPKDINNVWKCGVEIEVKNNTTLGVLGKFQEKNLFTIKPAEKVVDSKPLTITFAPVDVESQEGQAGTTEYLFTLLAFEGTPDPDNYTLPRDVTVKYTVTGSGSNLADAKDFVGGVWPKGEVEFKQGQSAKGEIIIRVQGDTEPEPNEEFTVTLQATDGTAIGNATVTGTIKDDDGGASSFASTGTGNQVQPCPTGKFRVSANGPCFAKQTGSTGTQLIDSRTTFGFEGTNNFGLTNFNNIEQNAQTFNPALSTSTTTTDGGFPGGGFPGGGGPGGGGPGGGGPGGGGPGGGGAATALTVTTPPPIVDADGAATVPEIRIDALDNLSAVAGGGFGATVVFIYNGGPGVANIVPNAGVFTDFSAGGPFLSDGSNDLIFQRDADLIFFKITIDITITGTDDSTINALSGFNCGTNMANCP